MTGRSRLARLLVLALATSLVAIPDRGASADASDGPIDPVTRSIVQERGISVAEAKLRSDWQIRGAALEELAAKRLGVRFGGVWIGVQDDRVKLGVVAVDATGRAAAEDLIATADLADGADTVSVRYALSQLEAANRWIGDRLQAANAGQRHTMMTGLRPDLNAVEMTLPSGRPMSTAQRSLVDDAVARFGPMLRFAVGSGRLVPTSCGYPYCDVPLRAGIRIYSRNGSRTSICTGGFLARSNSDQTLYMFTAGHCVRDGFTGTWFTRLTNGSEVAIGPVHNWQFAFNGDQGGDMAIIKVNDPGYWMARAWVFVTAGADTVRNEAYPIYGITGSRMHERICTTGGSYGRTDCGRITGLNQTATYNGQTIRQLGRSNLCTAGGDSGGPVYSNGLARGLNVAADGVTPCDSYFQGISAAQAWLRVTVARSG